MTAKVIIWGTGLLYSRYINLLSMYEEKGEIAIVGLTSNDYYCDYIDGYRFIRKCELLTVEFDYIIVAALHSYNQVLKEIADMGIDTDRVLRVEVFDIPQFCFRKYSALLKEKPTIVSNNCWGGVTYHSLKMPFYSPFINMFIDDEDYIRLIGSFEEYLKEDLKFYTTEVNPVEKFEYPVFRLGDVKLHMNHYRNVDNAINKWNIRKQRINFSNLFVMMYTQSREIARKFDMTEYKRKICFVPFETGGLSAMPVLPYIKQRERKEFWETVVGMASGKYPYYDVMDLMLTGKFTLRVNAGQ